MYNGANYLITSSAAGGRLVFVDAWQNMVSFTNVLLKLSLFSQPTLIKIAHQPTSLVPESLRELQLFNPRPPQLGAHAVKQPADFGPALLRLAAKSNVKRVNLKVLKGSRLEGQLNAFGRAGIKLSWRLY